MWEWGTVFPKGPWARCQGYRAHPWQSQEHPTLCTAVDMAASSLACCGFAGVPQELCSFWVSFEGL